MSRQSGGPAESVFARALLEARAPLHLGYRLYVRFQQFVAVDGAAGAGGGWWRVALIGFVALDIAIWTVLRRSDRFGLRWRLPLDALDIAFWSLSPQAPLYDLAALVAFPLAMETGVRRAARGLVIVPAVLVVIGTVRTIAGLPVQPFTIYWLVLGVGMGSAIRRYCDRLGARSDLDAARQAEAEAGRAGLAGQNAVAMGASSVVDAIEGLVPLLGRPATGSALDELACGWKARLGEATAGTATYLQVALLRWQRAHNRHPDLSSLVEVKLAEGAGTTLLTPGQEPVLAAMLDRLHLCGEIDVAVADPAASRQPGAALPLSVAGRSLVVPADPGHRQRPVDPAPVIFGFGAALTARDVLSGSGRVPWWAVATAAGAMVCAAVWSHRRLRDRGAGAHQSIVATAGLLAIGYGALGGATLQEPVNDLGARIFPIGGACLVLSLLVGLYHRDLSRAALVLAGAALATAAAVHMTLRLPAAVQWVDLPLVLGYPLALLPTALGVARSIVGVNRAMAAEAAAATATRAKAAFDAGRASVVSLVRRAHEEALGQLSANDGSGDPDVAALAERRLKEVGLRLESLGLAAAS